MQFIYTNMTFFDHTRIIRQSCVFAINIQMSIGHMDILFHAGCKSPRTVNPI